MTITLFVDGLCEPTNPGGVATYGLVAFMGQRKMYEQFGVVGEGPGMSNNVAEYQGLCEALRWLCNQGLDREEILVKSDSRLVVNQMSGQWKCHCGLYVLKFNEAQNLSKSFKKISYSWISREENSEADSLTRRAYEEYKMVKKAK